MPATVAERRACGKGRVGAGPGRMKRHAPATLRNREPIADVLREVLPSRGTVLEVASGTGEHCAFLAETFPALEWRPSDPDPTALASIAAWCERLSNVRPPVALDAASPDWPVERADAVVCVNMVHISPWEATLGLLPGGGGVTRERLYSGTA